MLGAGVMGLTAAKLLVEAGFTVRMYATSFLYTTSDVAGGQWCPSFVDHENTPGATQRFEHPAYLVHHAPRPDRAGLRRLRTGQLLQISAAADELQQGADRRHPSADGIRPSALRAPDQKGYGYHTLLVEPPIFLAKLRTELTGAVALTQKTFASAPDVVRLPEPIVVNCTGMGSRDIFDDAAWFRSRDSSC